MRKIISKLILTNLLVCLFMSGALANGFSDVSRNHWAYQEIVTLDKDNVVVGYPDGTFKPDQPATRAEFASMIVRALRQENCYLDYFYYFKDVPRSHWAFNMVERAHKFDLIKGYPTEYFYPERNIKRLDAILMMVASVETSNISEGEARRALNYFVDANTIPAEDRVNVGKAQILHMIANDPQKSRKLELDREITRAEISYSLYNMRRQALQRPNRKLAEAMRPKTSEGTVIDSMGITIDGNIATIPAGTLIPAALLSNFDSQQSKKGNLFSAKTVDNLITKEKYFLIPKGSIIQGEVTDVKPARYFIRNAKAVLETQDIAILQKPKAPFKGNVQIDQPKRKWYQKVINFVVKGTKIRFEEGQKVYIKLCQPIRVDITNQTVLSK